jgi:hypothetical protein
MLALTYYFPNRYIPGMEAVPLTNDRYQCGAITALISRLLKRITLPMKLSRAEMELVRRNGTSTAFRPFGAYPSWPFFLAWLSPTSTMAISETAFRLQATVYTRQPGT